MPKKSKESNIKTPSVTLAGLSLLDIDLAFDPSFEDSSDIQLNYHVEITSPKLMEDEFYSFTAELVISKSEKDAEESGTAVRVAYFGVLRCKNTPSEADVTLAAQEYTKTAIWSSFTSLAAVVTQQMRAQFPILPPIPVRVSIKAQEVDPPELS